MRDPKKTETVEVRIPFATKTAFMQRCRDRGLTASEAIRRYIDGELKASERPHLPKRLGGRRGLVAVVLAIMALGAVAAPSLAQTLQPQSSHATQAAFQQLDRNGDGVLTFEEFRAR